MATFPQLLKRSYADCNKVAKPLTIAVLIVGCAYIVMNFIVWGTVFTKGLTHVGEILGPDAAAVIQQQVTMGTPGPQMEQAMNGLAAQLQLKLAGMPEEEQAKLIFGHMITFFASVGPILIGFGILWMVIQWWYNAFVLVLGTKGKKSFGATASEAFSWMLPLVGLGLLTALMYLAISGITVLASIFLLMLSQSAGGDVPTLAIPVVIAGVLGVLFLAIRLVFAPVALVQDKLGIVESLRKSFRITKGKFWRIVGNLIGLAAVIWLVTFVVSMIISFVVGIAATFSPLALFVGQITVFVTLLVTAYSTIFTIRLKEDIQARKA
jgi:hypothetical protein